tara:strand:- start:576 stop:1727 length:1152 start_codon:yes stop_codon:yes gene_type:complete
MNIEIDFSLFPKLNNTQKSSDYIYFLLYTGYNQIFENKLNDINIEHICNKISNNIEESLDHSNIMDEINKNLHKLFSLNSSSSKKGEVSEQIIYDYFSKNYKNYCYEKKREIAHNADGELNSPSGLKALVEIKNYGNNVNNDEVNKFKFDLQFNNIHFGLFISFKTGIIGKKYIDYDHYYHNDNEYHIVYITNIYEDTTRLDCAILLLEKIYEISKNKNKEIKSLIYNNLNEQFNELNTVINKTTCLKDNFEQMDKTFKECMNNFYIQLREYDYDIKKQIKKIWENIDSSLNEVYINYCDNKEEILLKYKDDKCFLIINKLFDLLKDYDVIIDKNIWNIIKDNEKIGSIKKLKDKLNLELDSIKISITNKNIDSIIEKIKVLL